MAAAVTLAVSTRPPPTMTLRPWCPPSACRPSEAARTRPRRTRIQRPTWTMAAACTWAAQTLAAATLTRLPRSTTVRARRSSQAAPSRAPRTLPPRTRLRTAAAPMAAALPPSRRTTTRAQRTMTELAKASRNRRRHRSIRLEAEAPHGGCASGGRAAGSFRRHPYPYLSCRAAWTRLQPHTTRMPRRTSRRHALTKSSGARIARPTTTYPPPLQHLLRRRRVRCKCAASARATAASRCSAARSRRCASFSFLSFLCMIPPASSTMALDSSPARLLLNPRLSTDGHGWAQMATDGLGLTSVTVSSCGRWPSSTTTRSPRATLGASGPSPAAPIQRP